MPRYFTPTYVREFVRFIPACIAAVAISACGGGSSSTSGSPGDERINGHLVPPVPDAQANSATVKGVDSDRNGIRDDIDRYVATEFGTEAALYEKAVAFTKTEQAALLQPGTAAVEAHLAVLGCIGDRPALARLSNLTRAVLDTSARRRAYVKAFAGVSLSERSCK